MASSMAPRRLAVIRGLTHRRACIDARYRTSLKCADQPSMASRYSLTSSVASMFPVSVHAAHSMHAQTWARPRARPHARPQRPVKGTSENCWRLEWTVSSTDLSSSVSLPSTLPQYAKDAPHATHPATQNRARSAGRGPGFGSCAGRAAGSAAPPSALPGECPRAAAMSSREGIGAIYMAIKAHKNCHFFRQKKL